MSYIKQPNDGRWEVQSQAIEEMTGGVVGDLSQESHLAPGMPPHSSVLPRWELSLYLLTSLGFHCYSFYEVYRVSREHEEELDQEFELETNALFGGLKKWCPFPLPAEVKELLDNVV
ncbi:Protein-cysteine N-palmitoyltransferase HHAT [Fukomys damarensis]|uniref:Protein-cysteine N-palmitoyltransferase HHAT n=1 Tax=Fukomys damarensis TaxID=885580 RepID=A0A091CNT4_FUKDA|nr:Protein-cysteine N-palmitoyltransferase HHAT [Fukomys damarensis]